MSTVDPAEIAELLRLVLRRHAAGTALASATSLAPLVRPDGQAPVVVRFVMNRKNGG